MTGLLFTFAVEAKYPKAKKIKCKNKVRQISVLF